MLPVQRRQDLQWQSWQGMGRERGCDGDETGREWVFGERKVAGSWIVWQRHVMWALERLVG